MNYFKYYSANPKASSEEILAPLRYHSLRYVSADQFNDPYDSKCFFETLDGERDDSLSDTINRHLRIASMSRNPHSPIMWAHYSTNHAGYVMGYNLIELPSKAVDYEDIKPFCYSTSAIREAILKETPNVTSSELADVMKQHLLSNDSYMQYLMDAIFTKHLDWKYEEEHRFIDVNLGGIPDKYIDLDIGVINVRAILLGYKFDHEKLDNELKEIINHVYGGSIEVYKAELSLERYEMKFKPYEL
ncbi:hypothetical protein C9I86_08380 [Photobacterium sp. NCIMB 13483]|uniref:DUF2971 domain-containing protein n=1 Tax=Photobacterium sp. NCIMB 13483 TaxID=2022103 RepID=UPI000D17735A|nr:DUF2971 domain-containing protein [Photobacterium sp. NCIMB 13483]PST91303.1 hypothetical protein C9I86_08380 [Photobacterium sp. NCIMB 13483]